MAISMKQRRWILGAVLLMTVAAAASVDSQDGQDGQDGEVVLADKSGSRTQQRQAEPLENVEQEVLVEQLQRPAMPQRVKDVFEAKSWYMPPPASKIKPVPVAPPFPFAFIGKMKDEGARATVFLERQNRIYLVHEGDAIEGNYRVDTIKAPLMTLTYLPLDIKQTVQIGEAN